MTAAKPARIRTRVEATPTMQQSVTAQPWKGIGSSHACVHSGAHGDAASSDESHPSVPMQIVSYDFGRIPASNEIREMTRRSSGWSGRAASTTRRGSIHSRLPLTASIRIDSPRQTPPAMQSLRLAPQSDGIPGSEMTNAIDFRSFAPAAQSGEQTAAIAEPEEGQTVQLPDVTVPAMANVPQRDPVVSALTYNGSITQSGSPPSPFGETKPYTHALSGVSVTRSAGNFVVRATVDNPITFQVNGGADTNIASENDPAITQANYQALASDLTPDMSDENGRPPRNQFWAEDLTIRHEHFHAQEDLHFGGQGVTDAQAWLNTKAAGNVAGVQAFLNQVPGRVANTVATGMAFPGLEERAYGDGAPLYRARANAIKQKGDANGYAPAGGTTAPGAAGNPASGTGLSRGAKVGIGIAAGTAVGAGIGALAGGGVGAAVGAGAGLAVGLVGGLLA
ncbi:MAG TPA: hypothetical protein VFB43_01075 [Terracidiphilus sp.]|nr:hypothetical protein [Terracidiphilus sp.]